MPSLSTFLFSLVWVDDFFLAVCRHAVACLYFEEKITPISGHGSAASRRWHRERRILEVQSQNCVMLSNANGEQKRKVWPGRWHDYRKGSSSVKTLLCHSKRFNSVKTKQRHQLNIRQQNSPYSAPRQDTTYTQTYSLFSL
jgi:hypothetical protein